MKTSTRWRPWSRVIATYQGAATNQEDQQAQRVEDLFQGAPVSRRDEIREDDEAWNDEPERPLGQHRQSHEGVGDEDRSSPDEPQHSQTDESGGDRDRGGDERIHRRRASVGERQ